MQKAKALYMKKYEVFLESCSLSNNTELFTLIS